MSGGWISGFIVVCCDAGCELRRVEQSKIGMCGEKSFPCTCRMKAGGVKKRI